jgi:DNA modification methylase
MNTAILKNGDCMELIREVDDNSVDAVITSPPYNFDLEYGEYSDNKQWNDYFEWLDTLWRECYRVLKVGGRLIINIQPKWDAYMPTHSVITTRVLGVGFKWKGEILWEKNNYNCGYCTWGSFASPSSPYLKYTWEFVEVFVKDDYKHPGEKSNIDIAGDEFKEWVTAKWSIAPEMRMKEFEHPAMFPEELPRRLMKLFTYRNDTILDPFMGCGTTGAVCIKNKRNFIGFEIDATHFSKAKSRIETEIELSKYQKSE